MQDVESELNILPLAEAGKLLIGALARTELMHAVLEVANARSPVENMKGKRQLIAYINRQDFEKKAWSVFKRALRKERGDKELGDFEDELKSSGQKRIEKDDDFFKSRITDPLAEIYTQIKGHAPEPESRWLGELIIKAAKKPEIARQVYSHLSQFGLDPKTIVDEVYYLLDRELEKG